MRTIVYPRWIWPFFGALLGFGFLATLWPPTRWIGWGLLFQCFFLSLGFVCIYVAELENDLLADARQEVGDWNLLIAALSIYRTGHPDQAVITTQLQQLNRKYWQDYLKQRRLVLRQGLALMEQKAALQQLSRVGKHWIAHVEGLLAQNHVQCGPAEEHLHQQLKAFKAV
jgi:hypothetical protein